MKRTSIFVIADPTAEHQEALLKALLIAKTADCDVHAFLCSYRDIDESGAYASRNDFKRASLGEAEAWLERKVEPLKVAGVKVSCEVVWNSKWYQSALRAIEKSACDLVIKSSFRHGRAKRFYSTTSDYYLMRHCSRPILFAHESQEWRSDRVLACVDLESTEREHARLNGLIVEDARALAELVGMDLHFAAAYSDRIKHDDLPIDGHGKQFSLQRLGELCGVDESRFHLRKGEVVATLAKICDELDPAIVVIGTLARTGFRGKLIGNTAEKLLDRIDADLLTVI